MQLRCKGTVFLRKKQIFSFSFLPLAFENLHINKKRKSACTLPFVVVSRIS